MLESTRAKVIVAAYVRISDPNRDGESEIQSQKQAIRDFCEKNGYILPEEYFFEEAISAYSLPYKKRPELMKLLAAAKRGEFKIVIVFKLSRIARTAGEMGFLLGLFEIDYQVEVISVLDPPNQTKQERAIGRALHGIVSEMEHDNIVESTMRGKRDRVRLEKRLLGQGSPCYGYVYKDKTRSQYAYMDQVYCTDTEGKEWTEHEVADLLLNQLIQGVPLRRIQKSLNERGIPTRSGKPWHKGTLHNMATNPAYAGIAIGFRWEKKPGKKSMQLRNEEDTILLPAGTIPAMITPEEHKQIMRQFELNKQTCVRNSKFPEVGIMRGRVFCSTCGKSCYISHPTIRGKMFFSYECRHMDQVVRHTAPTVLVSLVDEASWAMAVDHIQNPALVLDRVEDLLKKDTEVVHTERLQAKLTEITDKLKKLMIYAMDATDADVIAMARENRLTLEKEKRGIEKLLAVNIRDDEKETGIRKEIEKFIGWCDTVRPFLNDSTYEISIEEKRKAVTILGIVATIYTQEHKPRVTTDLAPKYLMEALVDAGFETQVESLFSQESVPNSKLYLVRRSFVFVHCCLVEMK